jgi:hypothetical protein
MADHLENLLDNIKQAKEFLVEFECAFVNLSEIQQIHHKVLHHLSAKQHHFDKFH